MTTRSQRKNWSFKQKAKRSWPYSASRMQVCEVYRKVRKDNPAMARLLYRRNCDVQRKMADQLERMIYTSGTGGAGLASLLS